MFTKLPYKLNQSRLPVTFSSNAISPGVTRNALLNMTKFFCKNGISDTLTFPKWNNTIF